MAEHPVVLFVCVQNAGRSQMAEALFDRAAAGRATARSAGSRPASAVHPNVVSAMNEIGIDLGDARPKSIEAVPHGDVNIVVTMGCGDECPYIPGARVVDWDIADPSGEPIEVVRTIRDDIAARSEALVAELTARDRI